MDLSIVIATRDRRELLGYTLASIEAAEAARGEGRGDAAASEVVVVDHGSSDGTADLLADYARRLPLRIVPLEFRDESIAEPKNAGAAAARGDIVAFVDSGVLCAPGFAAAHLAAHHTAAGSDVPGSCVAGGVLGWDSEDETDPFWTTVDPARMPGTPLPEWPEFLEDPRIHHWDADSGAQWLLMWGANLSVSRHSFLDVGGFDTGMSGWGWDDLELGFRLSRAGLRQVYAPDAWALHYPHPRAPLASRMATSERNWLRAYARHAAPELELWDRCDFWGYADCLTRVESTWRDVAQRLYDPPPRSEGVGRRVLFGFALPAEPEPGDVFVLPPAVGRRPPNPGVVTAYGLRTPLGDGCADVAVVSPALLAFDWPPSPGWPPLVDVMLREAVRVAGRVEVAGPDAGRRLGALAERAAA
ncbi:MAG: glycosyltransferase family 2 protein [Pseudonocardiaceae bacterium]